MPYAIRPCERDVCRAEFAPWSKTQRFCSGDCAIAARAERMWPAERVEALRALSAEGLTAREIGNRLGATKSAVLGKMDRLRNTPQCR